MKNSLLIDIILQIAWTDIDKSCKHEVICEDEELNVELDFLLLDVEVVWINILNDASKEADWNSLYTNASLLWDQGFRELVLCWKHRPEVLTSGHKDQAVCFDQSIFNIENNIVELIKILALVHARHCFVVKFFKFVLRRLNARNSRLFKLRKGEPHSFFFFLHLHFDKLSDLGLRMISKLLFFYFLWDKLVKLIFCINCFLQEQKVGVKKAQSFANLRCFFNLDECGFVNKLATIYEFKKLQEWSFALDIFQKYWLAWLIRTYSYEKLRNRGWKLGFLSVYQLLNRVLIF